MSVRGVRRYFPWQWSGTFGTMPSIAIHRENQRRRLSNSERDGGKLKKVASFFCGFLFFKKNRVAAMPPGWQTSDTDEASANPPGKE